ncbi:galactokinase [Candidatus Methylopumilus universalis]|uniref:GHMP family kinase ATP-binding protein n=1 Tax=Candidatus Methylopumilus universalis TaxID=2588536 RepID=UPI00112354D7|nr:galactokinase [Candidatus Methylopumilus universalis]QDC46218.1 galactokinase [Candidatus Methylopumilus universalis]
MIIVRSPLRISLGGGGTDLQSYYKEHEGFLIAAAIDKYVYITINRPFLEGIYLKYSSIENVKDVSEVQHKIIREVLKMQNFRTPQIEITTLTDIPSGTGLGSSGSFTTGLLKALFSYRKRHIHQEELAALACHVEIDRLGEPIGKQDQYIAAIGGITSFAFHKDDRVISAPVNLSVDTLFDLEDNLLLFFTGFARSASSILNDQKVRSEKNDESMISNLHYVKELGYRSKNALENGDTQLFGELMHEHWENKKRRSGSMTNSDIDNWYNLAMKNGAIGGKLVGAGGGGFLMFMAKDKLKLRKAMKENGLEEVRFKFDFEGTKVIHS